MKIVQLSLKPDKGAPVQAQDTLHVSGEGGITGDIRSLGNMQISLWSSSDLASVAGTQPQGLCMRRFSANVIIDGLQVEELRPGDMLLLGDVRVRITQMGKSCYPDECALPGLGIRCPLQSCLYGQIETDGVLRLGDTVICLPASGL